MKPGDHGSVPGSAAGPRPTRRSVLKGLAALPLLASPWPTLCAPAAAASGGPRPVTDASDRVLVIVQLTGGNDGLNTVVPYADDDYHRARPVLAIAPKSVLELSDELGLHPALSGLHELWGEGALTVVNNVGYPDPDRSHFRSMEIWHTASLAATPPRAGWLGRLAGRAGADAALPFARLGGRDLPLALAGAPSQVPAIGDLDDLEPRYADRSGAERLVKSVCTAAAERGDDAGFIASAYAAAFETAQRLGSLSASMASVPFPGTSFARDLQLAARLIGAGAGTRVLYLTEGGFDTHAGQLSTHPALLRALSDGLTAFQRQLEKQGDAERVTTLVFSEFGRRIHENASGGTDHGQAAPVLLVGRPPGGGVLGPPPDLSGGKGADVPLTTDFRAVYASALEWLGFPAAPVIEGRFEPLELFT